jgi:hypothetical protein
VIRGLPVKILEFCLYLPLAAVVVCALLVGTGLVGIGWVGRADFTLHERFLYVVPAVGLASGIPGVIVHRVCKMLFGQEKKRYPEIERGRYDHLYEQRPSTSSESKG